MKDLSAVGLTELEGVAAAVGSGRVPWPLTEAALERLLPTRAARLAIQQLYGLDAVQVVLTLRLVVAERRRTQQQIDRVELVWTGPEVDEASRDTSVVVRELFRRARGSILVSSFAIDTGGKAESLFGELATRMDAEPSLNVRMFLNIHRGDSQATEAELVRGFARTFRERIWPGERKPSVFYDPRALAPAGGPRACLHAKCVVVDDAYAFVTSANFTEAAHGRNIEAGVLIEDPAFAKGLRSQFDALVEAGGVVALPR